MLNTKLVFLGLILDYFFPCIFAVQPVALIFSCQGVAMGVGLCANSHLEGTLAKLDEFGKSDAFKKSPSIFNLLKVPKMSFL